MKLNERGTTLAVVLLVILTFSVLGIALMGSVVNENKRVNVTEDDVQARNLAESGLTYFVSEFNHYVAKTEPSFVNINTFLDHYKTPVDPNNKGEINIAAARDISDPDIILATSTGSVGAIHKTLIGHYKISFDVQIPTDILAEFNKDGTKPIDFAKGLVGLNALGILNTDVIQSSGNDNEYYPVPTSGGLEVEALGLGVGIGNNFDYLAQTGVVAVREGTFLSTDLSTNNLLLTIDVNSYTVENDTNVIINGEHNALIGKDYDDIIFKKLAVTGNTIIQQHRSDRDPIRYFSFIEGLFVKKSLVIGGSEKVSKLQLHGNMVAMNNLDLNNVDLKTGDRGNPEAIYVHGNVTITNACINKNGDANSDFRLFTKGKITFNVDGTPACNTFNGFFYAEKGIEVENVNTSTSGPLITINGGMIGENLTPSKLRYNPNSNFIDQVKLTYNKLIPLGRTFD